MYIYNVGIYETQPNWASLIHNIPFYSVCHTGRKHPLTPCAMYGWLVFYFMALQHYPLYLKCLHPVWCCRRGYYKQKALVPASPIGKSLSKILSRSLKNLACKQALTRCDKILEQESWKIDEITMVAKIWQDFGTILSHLATSFKNLARLFW